MYNTQSFVSGFFYMRSTIFLRVIHVVLYEYFTPFCG